MCCRNTLVCDSVQEAKALAFGGHERHKVVALDGTVFAKAGLITGGTSSNIEARAQKWDEKAMQELRQVCACRSSFQPCHPALDSRISCTGCIPSHDRMA